MAKILYVFLVLVISTKLFSQETSNTILKYNVLNTNPAYISIDNYFKISLYNRNQSNQVISKNGITSFEFIVPFINNSKNKGGIGISINSRQYGEMGNLSSKTINLAYAYNVNLSKKISISSSLSFTGGRNEFNINHLTTGSQYVEHQGFDNNISINEDLYSQSKYYFDISAGIFAKYINEKKINKFYLGISAFHLNKPNISFTNYDQNLDYRFSLQSGILLLSNQKIKIMPDIIIDYYMNNFYYNAGVNFKLPIFDQKASVEINPRYIFSNFLFLNLEFNYSKYSIGFSYFYNISNTYSTINYLQGNEINLSYKFRLKESNRRENYTPKSDYKIGDKYKL